jgi:hypothetical protein
MGPAAEIMKAIISARDEHVGDDSRCDMVEGATAVTTEVDVTVVTIGDVALLVVTVVDSGGGDDGSGGWQRQ